MASRLLHRLDHEPVDATEVVRVAGVDGLLAVGGIAVFAFALVGVYLFFDAMSVANGGSSLPMGPPLIKS